MNKNPKIKKRGRGAAAPAGVGLGGCLSQRCLRGGIGAEPRERKAACRVEKHAAGAGVGGQSPPIIKNIIYLHLGP